jgi:subfamily B ATP-binding cassette protein MsbA
LGAAICMSLAAAMNVGALLQLQPIFDKIFSGKSSAVDFAAAMKVYPGLMLALMLLKGVFSFTGDVLNGMATNKLTADIREEVYAKLVELPLSYHSNSRAGQLLARVTNDINLMPAGICEVLGRIFGAGLNIITILGAMFYINWKLALIVTVAFPVCFGPLIHFSRRLRRHSNEGQDRMADLTVQLHETLAGIRVIMSFGTQPQEKARFKTAVWAHYRAVMRQIRTAAAASPVMESIIATGGFFLILVAGAMVRNSDLTTGQLMTLAALLGSIYPQIKTANGVNSAIQGALTGSQRVFSLLDEPVGIQEKPDAVSPKGLEKGVRFQKVCFEYVPGHPVLVDVDLEIPAGSTVALVGPSGGGKTTLVDLVPRFHDPKSGVISLDGVDLRDLRLQELRGLIGVVTQETFLFNDTIANNIRYGCPNATDAQVREAAQVANAHEFIEKQAEGYETRIGDRGARLSGGQRQRLSIARAVLRNPPLLILDEATSALDTESERLVQQALERLMQRRTSLVIAHRLSTVRNADLIVVVEKGHIVERGRHDDLIAQGGTYARLCQMQFMGGAPAAAPALGTETV